MLIDLHVHSHHTRGCALAPRDVVRRAREAGLDGVAFTDHDTLEGLEEIRAAARDEGLVALCGVEVTTDRGHFLCFFPDPAAVPAPVQLFGAARPWPVREVLARVRQLGGAAVAAHPYDKTVERPCGDVVFTLDGLSAIEGLNARRKGPANDLAIEAADHMSLPCTGGSGAHELAEIGKAATLFRDPVASEADVVRQLRAGTVYCVAVGVTPSEPDRAPRDRGGERGDRGDRGDRGGHRGHGHGRGRGHGGGGGSGGGGHGGERRRR
ncbi:PHP domain protein [Anaeromyxobacter dehalogenans 2CP-1]|uniref:PHP domain protein n=1 Tax=Anaeromyxobacter dehalogenans (strain ATCC BAA-258 / DSM 21875 / 2CP-1) TaxID=455488 RepID=B8JHA9_ANAD2|nr:PHP domain-containing protein [Anaeromyxobacter dehalogenans]ACL64811.1 PHP domain protein [Anaeromyxobacter dehalogenans 2CP-1]